MMNDIIRNLVFVNVYLDNVVIFSPTNQEHIGHVRLGAHLVPVYGLNARTSKRELAKEKVALLSHFVSMNCVQVYRYKV